MDQSAQNQDPKEHIQVQPSLSADQQSSSVPAQNSQPSTGADQQSSPVPTQNSQFSSMDGNQQHPRAPAQPVHRTFDQNHPYYHILNQVVDPETGVGLADMGIIYQINETDGVIEVIMTLTSMGCPAGPMMTTDIDGVLRLQEGVKDVEIQVVWDPPWTPDMMNPEVRAMLFGGF